MELKDGKVQSCSKDCDETRSSLDDTASNPRCSNESKPSATSNESFTSQATTLHFPSTPSQDFHASKALELLREYELPPHSRASSDSLVNFALSPPKEQDDSDSVDPPSSSVYATSPQSPLTPGGVGDASSRKRKQLNVVDQRHGDRKLVYMAARANHFSFGQGSPLWNVMIPSDMRLIELELRHALKPRYARDPKKDPVDHLRVAMGHMLERIVYWDRDAAVDFENSNDAKALSTLPLLDDSDQERMCQIVQKFRAAIRRLKHSDWRRFWADLEDEILYQLLRFTFMHARPVLAWELDFEEVG